MRLLFPIAISISMLSAAHAQHKHVHGEGRLDVAIDGGKISLALELPLDAAVGFERPPRSDKEMATLAATVQALDAAALYAPTPAANCTLQSKTVHVPFTGGDDQHGQHAHEGETHHADIEATHVYSCANPAALKGIETTLFKHFKRLYRLETRRSGPAGQGAARLTPKQPVLNW
jgi:hypothetical protein